MVPPRVRSVEHRDRKLVGRRDHSGRLEEWTRLVFGGLDHFRLGLSLLHGHQLGVDDIEWDSYVG